jgi:ABC-type transport system involved in multi-copper enzyme maturation permease subunit
VATGGSPVASAFGDGRAACRHDQEDNTPVMFAALTFDREPLTFSWGWLLSALISWTQTVGGFAAIGLFIGLTVVLIQRGGHRREERSTLLALLAGTAALAALSYVVVGLLYLPEILDWLGSEGGTLEQATGWRRTAQEVFWTAAGGFAILGVLVPLLPDLPRLSLRRVNALALLSFKEAVRRKVLWVFLALLLVVLFGSWFIPHKPEDEVRNYVQVVSLAEALLLIFAALLMTSFGIPDDMRHQTIHTVITKPVERFEIFLGRFLGYAFLLTLALVGMTLLGLSYVLRGVGEEAARETLKARVPMYGQLEFEGTKDRAKGDNVGREWEYRSYIFGPVPGQPTQYAVWNFDDIATLSRRDWVWCEFTLDIYRTTKGVEGQGVFCTFIVESWGFDSGNPAAKARHDQRRKELQTDPEVLAALKDDPRLIEKKLAEEFGYFEVPSVEIKDYHTQSFKIPGGVFRNALAIDPERRRQLSQRKEGPPAPVRIRLRCDSRTQFVGMAKYDLFLRVDDPETTNDRFWFCVNFVKGSLGLWMRLCLITGVAVALSTYLSGVITLLTTGIIYLLGFFQDFIAEVAFRRAAGGGPLEAGIRLIRRPGGESLVTPLEETATVQISTGLDEVFSWLLRRVMDLIPDVTRFSFTDYVAEGVAISGGEIIVTLLLLVGYVLPWTVLAYYLLRWREIAGNM